MKHIKMIIALFLLICLLPLVAAADEYPFLLTAGGSFGYCRDDQGTLLVYGDNQFGQLGKGGKAQSKRPAVFASKNSEIDVAHIREIYAGCDYSFFLMDDGTIYGVGNNAYNPLLLGLNRSMAATHVRIPLEDRTIVKMACGFGHPLPAKRMRPLFAYLMARASREACREAGIAEPCNVSRCGMAGTPRVATTWTGDNYTAFRELRYNHYQAMTMSLSGFYFFGPDIGGFAGPKPDEELFFRWLQYGVFLPRFVLHSWKPGAPSTMPWLYPEKMEAVRQIFALREGLAPYLHRQMERSRRSHDPLIYPVFLRQPGYDCDSDCFFCGDHILACPVFDQGADSVTVTLPTTAERWRLRGQGAAYPGGETVTVACPWEGLPVWFTGE